MVSASSRRKIANDADLHVISQLCTTSQDAKDWVVSPADIVNSRFCARAAAKLCTTDRLVEANSARAYGSLVYLAKTVTYYHELLLDASKPPQYTFQLDVEGLSGPRSRRQGWRTPRAAGAAAPQ